MSGYKRIILCISIIICSSALLFSQNKSELSINNSGYFDLQSLNVMLFDDFYPEGHQGGLTIIHFGERVAANGDLRLEPIPGQWSPIPKLLNKSVDAENGIIKAELVYPDSSRDKKGFNPIDYPDLNFTYTVTAEAVGHSIKLTVDLDKPLPVAWADKVGFNLELFPSEFFGEYYLMDGKPGLFPRQANGPVNVGPDGSLHPSPICTGKEFIAVPGSSQKEIKITSNKGDIQLYDGRDLYNNGWYILRSTIPAGAAKKCIEWLITPSIDTTWRYKPVIQISEVGYHPAQKKFAIVELDNLTDKFEGIQLIKITGEKETVIKSDKDPTLWGNFLRYKYLRFDFSEVTDEGLYKINYGKIESNEFIIAKDVFAKDVWQPTLEYFLPVQMCHMKVIDRYRTWHGLCHMDDALMAPINHVHFDGYHQAGSTFTKFNPGDHVPGINIGGWHDAGDYDLRIESQAETIYKLSLAYELFKNNDDQTTINQSTRLVEIHKPDGKPDILQQIEHGALSIVGGYEAMGRFYRGIICSSLEQYVLLGDGSTMTDNFVYKSGEKDPILNKQLPKDDRLVFTEVNPRRELYTAQVLAAVYRTLKIINPELAKKCLSISEEVFEKEFSGNNLMKLNTAAELYLSTSKDEYKKLLIENADTIAANIPMFAITAGRTAAKINDQLFTSKIESAVKNIFAKVSEMQKDNPYGVPYRPNIWGAGWGIQSLGVGQLFLYMGFPNSFPPDYVFNSLNFVLGCHPGNNTASFASGVGTKSLTVAYGVNRADWSYIPGGVASGTALIRPDLPELKTWPYFWQQTEYVMGGGAADYILLAMAADYYLNNK